MSGFAWGTVVSLLGLGAVVGWAGLSEQHRSLTLLVCVFTCACAYVPRRNNRRVTREAPSHGSA